MAARTERVAVTRHERRVILSCLDGSAGLDLAVSGCSCLTEDDNIDADTVLTHFGNFTDTCPA
jgi:hypothetical protein